VPSEEPKKRVLEIGIANVEDEKRAFEERVEYVRVYTITQRKKEWIMQCNEEVNELILKAWKFVFFYSKGKIR